jgi:hypothetical protein
VTFFSLTEIFWSPIGFIGDLYFSDRNILVTNRLHWLPFFFDRDNLVTNRLELVIPAWPFMATIGYGLIDLFL